MFSRVNKTRVSFESTRITLLRRIAAHPPLTRLNDSPEWSVRNVNLQVFSSVICDERSGAGHFGRIAFPVCLLALQVLELQRNGCKRVVFDSGIGFPIRTGYGNHFVQIARSQSFQVILYCLRSVACALTRAA